MYKINIGGNKAQFNSIDDLIIFLKEYISDVHSEETFHSYKFTIEMEEKGGEI